LPDARSSSQTGGVPGAAASVTYGIGLFALFIVAKNALVRVLGPARSHPVSGATSRRPALPRPKQLAIVDFLESL